MVVSRNFPPTWGTILAPASVVPAASSLSPTWRENSRSRRRRPREAQIPPRKRLIVRGVIPTTTQSDLPLTRATARLAPQGQVQWIGGDARQRRKTERGRFGANLFDSELPRSVLGICTARRAPTKSAARVLPRRPRRPRPRGESAIWARLSRRRNSASEAKHLPEKRGLTNTLKGDPCPMEQTGNQRSLWGQLSQAPSGAGWESQPRPLEERERTNQRRRWESPKPPLGNAKPSPTLPRRGYPLAEGDPKVWPDRRSPPKAVARGLRTSGGATHNSPALGDTFAKPLGAGESGIGKAFERRGRTPNAAAPRPLGQRPSLDEYGDFSRTTPQRARRGGLSTDR